MMDEQSVSKIYKSMWGESVKGFENNKFDYDQFLNYPIHNHRSGLTMIGRLNVEVSKRFLGL
jgi:hypothetical protein